ncbi:MAG: chemotaxis protein methyltransferase CheR [Methanothermococcus sp.]|jgi:chemotaxis protein methyltransferase CheR|uniref:CheR family methyltransferase n=1 Tax=Methanothermococcus TaxID=155862 RepID=UPI0003734BAF|nr:MULTISPECIES: protein-glutamate O-methyltransferase CheR [Methanothermococcus]MDK2790559.1 chemotaxis protein methyltransferase CheR [Methanothermococcus sp.]MDK2988055.1 chemotaxis protein methyltransferase CheR [Methanothermococcus sp.]
MDEKYFERIKRDIKTKLNIQIDQYKDAYIKRRISVRMRACKCKTYKEYYEYLIKNNPDEYKKLESTLTVNVTEFWRDRTVYEEIKKILEKMISDRTTRSIRIWSAGCSSGEEPYGIAIIINELLEKYNRKFMRVSITATDIDREVIEKARKGIYIDKQLKNIDPLLIPKYFNKLDDNQYQIRSIVKKYVKFKQHDMIKEPPISNMDMILCRNVIIYFDKDIQEKLFLKFYESLVDGGYLILGKTEMLHGKARDLFKPVNHRERIYQK